MTTIADAATHITTRPAPVLFIDTCSFLDLFRRDGTRKQPRVAPDEVRAAADLLQLATAHADAVHLVVPELVPREFADNAGEIEQDFQRWLRFHDDNQSWLADAAVWVGVSLPAPALIQSVGLHARFRQLADNLLTQAIVLDRDQACLDRAVARLIAKRRPSHKKEIKDSMNLEQCLEFSARLHGAGFARPRVFVSSNTTDFAEHPSPRLHPDLQPEFAACSLEYFPSLQGTLGSLRARGEF